VITTERELADRLNVPSETLAMASQQQGGVKAYLRAVILGGQESRIVGRGADGKGAMSAAEAFAVVFGEPVEIKRKRATK
jgi:hypothetical protein